MLPHQSVPTVTAGRFVPTPRRPFNGSAFVGQPFGGMPDEPLHLQHAKARPSVVKPILATLGLHIGTALLAACLVLVCDGIAGSRGQNGSAILYGIVLVQQVLTLLGLRLLLRPGETAEALFAIVSPDRVWARSLLIRTGNTMLGLGALMAIGVLLSEGNLSGPTGSLAESARLKGAAFWMSLPATVLLAPVAEELLFRGYLLKRLIAAGLGHWPVMLLTAALFGLMHYHLGLHGVIVIGAGGVLLAYTRLKTGSIWPCIAMHMGWNGLITLLGVLAAAAGKV